jgi:FkbM family methyltransferase
VDDMLGSTLPLQIKSGRGNHFAMGPQSLVRRTARVVRSTVGQWNFYRAVRLLMYEAQFDVLNEPATNGEHYLQSTILHHFPSAVVFDIGANVGEWTESLLRQCDDRGATIHAFEPCRRTFEMLEERARSWKGVTLTRAACSDHVGQGRLMVEAAGSGTNALVKEEFTCCEVVALETVDSYCQKQSVTRINLMKVDAEGHDLSILVGAQRMLQTRAVDVIQFEYNHRWINERKLLRDAFTYLLPLGYRIGKLTGDGIQFYPGWHWELETYREGNYVACLPKWSELFRVVPAEWVPYS